MQFFFLFLEFFLILHLQCLISSFQISMIALIVSIIFASLIKFRIFVLFGNLNFQKISNMELPKRLSQWHQVSESLIRQNLLIVHIIVNGIHFLQKQFQYIKHLCHQIVIKLQSKDVSFYINDQFYRKIYIFLQKIQQLMQQIINSEVKSEEVQRAEYSSKNKLITAQFLCVKRNQAHYFCSNPDCTDPPLICEVGKCECHAEIHTQCSLKTIESVISKIEAKTRINVGQQIISKVESFYNRQIDKISEQRQKILFKLRNFGLGPSELQLAAKIADGYHTQINGSHIDSVVKQSEEQFNYELQIDAAKIWDARVGQLEKQYEEVNKKVFSQVFNFLAKYRPLNSRILVDQQLFVRNAFQKQSVYAKHLYSASQNKFSVKKFHEKCNGKEGCLVLFETISGKIGAAYTKSQWRNETGNAKDNEAFLFNIQTNKRIPAAHYQDHQAIYHDANLGPCFGLTDLRIMDKANQNLCRIQKSSVFNYQGMKSVFGSPKNQQKGSFNNPFFESKQEITSQYYLLKEWEVFQIKDVALRI